MKPGRVGGRGSGNTSPGLDWHELTEERFIANGTSRLLKNTAAGSGITTLPRLAFPVGSQTLRFIPLSEPALVRQIGIIKPAHRSLSPSAQALERFIQKQLASVKV